MENEYFASIKNTKYNPNGKIMVSVAIIAYNVEDYIPEAIESVLNQVTNFKVEIVIGEDCSTDNTRNIILNYQKQYPDIIKVFYHEKNLGLTPNSIATQNACKGKYIALLDGDDFWTDENKLQKQVDFLEKNKEYSACAHQSVIIKGINEDRDLGIKDTINHRKFHTSSLVYRKKYWDISGGIPHNISSNERAIYPMLAIYGKIKYLKDSMCVYRLAPTGLNSRISAKELETDLNMLPWLYSLDKSFPIKRFRSFIHLTAYTYPSKVLFFSLLKHYILFVFFSFSYFPQNLGDIKYGTRHIFKNIKTYKLK